MSTISMKHVEIDGKHIIGVYEKHPTGWSLIRNFTNVVEEFAKWEATVFAFEEATNLRVGVDGKDTVYKAMAESGKYPPKGFIQK